MKSLLKKMKKKQEDKKVPESILKNSPRRQKPALNSKKNLQKSGVSIKLPKLNLKGSRSNQSPQGSRNQIGDPDTPKLTKQLSDELNIAKLARKVTNFKTHIFYFPINNHLDPTDSENAETSFVSLSNRSQDTIFQLKFLWIQNHSPLTKTVRKLLLGDKKFNTYMELSLVKLMKKIRENEVERLKAFNFKSPETKKVGFLNNENGGGDDEGSRYGDNSPTLDLKALMSVAKSKASHKRKNANSLKDKLREKGYEVIYCGLGIDKNADVGSVCARKGIFGHLNFFPRWIGKGRILKKGDEGYSRQGTDQSLERELNQSRDLIRPRRVAQEAQPQNEEKESDSESEHINKMIRKHAEMDKDSLSPLQREMFDLSKLKYENKHSVFQLNLLREFIRQNKSKLSLYYEEGVLHQMSSNNANDDQAFRCFVRGSRKYYRHDCTAEIIKDALSKIIHEQSTPSAYIDILQYFLDSFYHQGLISRYLIDSQDLSLLRLYYTCMDLYPNFRELVFDQTICLLQLLEHYKVDEDFGNNIRRMLVEEKYRLKKAHTIDRRRKAIDFEVQHRVMKSPLKSKDSYKKKLNFVKMNSIDSVEDDLNAIGNPTIASKNQVASKKSKNNTTNLIKIEEGILNKEERKAREEKKKYKKELEALFKAKKFSIKKLLIMYIITELDKSSHYFIQSMKVLENLVSFASESIDEVKTLYLTDILLKKENDSKKAKIVDIANDEDVTKRKDIVLKPKKFLNLSLFLGDLYSETFLGICKLDVERRLEYYTKAKKSENKNIKIKAIERLSVLYYKLFMSSQKSIEELNMSSTRGPKKQLRMRMSKQLREKFEKNLKKIYQKIFDFSTFLVNKKNLYAYQFFFKHYLRCDNYKSGIEKIENRTLNPIDNILITRELCLASALKYIRPMYILGVPSSFKPAFELLKFLKYEECYDVAGMMNEMNLCFEYAYCVEKGIKTPQNLGLAVEIYDTLLKNAWIDKEKIKAVKIVQRIGKIYQQMNLYDEAYAFFLLSLKDFALYLSQFEEIKKVELLELGNILMALSRVDLSMKELALKAWEISYQLLPRIDLEYIHHYRVEKKLKKHINKFAKIFEQNINFDPIELKSEFDEPQTHEERQESWKLAQILIAKILGDVDFRRVESIEDPEKYIFERMVALKTTLKKVDVIQKQKKKAEDESLENNEESAEKRRQRLEMRRQATATLYRQLNKEDKVLPVHEEIYQRLMRRIIDSTSTTRLITPKMIETEPYANRTITFSNRVKIHRCHLIENNQYLRFFEIEIHNFKHFEALDSNFVYMNLFNPLFLCFYGMSVEIMGGNKSPLNLRDDSYGGGNGLNSSRDDSIRGLRLPQSMYPDSSKYVRVRLFCDDFEHIADSHNREGFWMPKEQPIDSLIRIMYHLSSAVSSFHIIGKPFLFLNPKHLALLRDGRVKLIVPFFMDYFSDFFKIFKKQIKSTKTNFLSSDHYVYHSPEILRSLMYGEKFAIKFDHFNNSEIHINGVIKSTFTPKQTKLLSFDVYSLGIFFLQILTASRIFPKGSFNDSYKIKDHLAPTSGRSQVFKKALDRLIKQIKGQFRFLRPVIRSMLRDDPAARPNIFRIKTKLEEVLFNDAFRLMGVNKAQVYSLIFASVRFRSEGTELENIGDGSKKVIYLPKRLKFQGDVNENHMPDGNAVIYSNNREVLTAKFQEGYPCKDLIIRLLDKQTITLEAKNGYPSNGLYRRDFVGEIKTLKIKRFERRSWIPDTKKVLHKISGILKHKKFDPGAKNNKKMKSSLLGSQRGLETNQDRPRGGRGRNALGVTKKLGNFKQVAEAAGRLGEDEKEELKGRLVMFNPEHMKQNEEKLAQFKEYFKFFKEKNTYSINKEEEENNRERVKSQVRRKGRKRTERVAPIEENKNNISILGNGNNDSSEDGEEEDGDERGDSSLMEDDLDSEAGRYSSCFDPFGHILKLTTMPLKEYKRRHKIEPESRANFILTFATEFLTDQDPYKNCIRFRFDQGIIINFLEFDKIAKTVIYKRDVSKTDLFISKINFYAIGEMGALRAESSANYLSGDRKLNSFKKAKDFEFELQSFWTKKRRKPDSLQKKYELQMNMVGFNDYGEAVDINNSRLKNKAKFWVNKFRRRKQEAGGGVMTTEGSEIERSYPVQSYQQLLTYLMSINFENCVVVDLLGNYFKGKISNGKLATGDLTMSSGEKVLLESGNQDYFYGKIFRNTYRYKGQIIYLRQEGYGVLKKYDRCIYEGHFHENLPHGKGVLLDPKTEQIVFNGIFRKGLKIFGTFIHNGFMFKGSFVPKVRSLNPSKQNLFEYNSDPSNFVFDGVKSSFKPGAAGALIKARMFENCAVVDGPVKAFFPDSGGKYVGKYYRDQKNGRGVLVNGNGDKLIGNWKNHEIFGKVYWNVYSLQKQYEKFEKKRNALIAAGFDEMGVGGMLGGSGVAGVGLKSSLKRNGKFGKSGEYDFSADFNELSNDLVYDLGVNWSGAQTPAVRERIIDTRDGSNSKKNRKIKFSNFSENLKSSDRYGDQSGSEEPSSGRLDRETSRSEPGDIQSPKNVQTLNLANLAKKEQSEQEISSDKYRTRLGNIRVDEEDLKHNKSKPIIERSAKEEIFDQTKLRLFQYNGYHPDPAYSKKTDQKFSPMFRAYSTGRFHYDTQGSILQTGYGIVGFTDGSEYRGRLKNSLFHGPGQLRFPDGSYYKGMFHEGLYEGLGILYNHVNRTKIRGHFLMGAPHKSCIYEVYQSEDSNGAKNQALADSRRSMMDGEQKSYLKDKLKKIGQIKHLESKNTVDIDQGRQFSRGQKTTVVEQSSAIGQSTHRTESYVGSNQKRIPKRRYKGYYIDGQMAYGYFNKKDIILNQLEADMKINHTRIVMILSSLLYNKIENRYILHGHTTAGLANRGKYQGEIFQGSINGIGKVFSFVSDGGDAGGGRFEEEYLGEFKNGMFEGLGVFWMENKLQYEGRFLKGKEHGFGAYKRQYVSKIGKFVEGKRQGLGCVLNMKRLVQISEFEDGVLDGVTVKIVGRHTKERILELYVGGALKFIHRFREDEDVD